MSVLDLALDAAARGWHVFPCKPHDKRPVTLKGWHDATADIAGVRQLFAGPRHFNYGIACAPSGLYVIDIDMGPGKVGAETWDKHLAAHEHVDTFTVRTPSGGLHLYYLAPAGLAPSSASRLGDDIDTPANGYVMGPGSVIGEDRYVVEDARDPVPLPNWIIEIQTPTPRSRKSRTAPHATDVEVMSRIAELATVLRDAPDGAGNTTAARVAFWAGQYVGAGQVDERYVLGVLFDAISGWSWKKESDFKRMERTLESQVAAGVQSPRAWTASVKAEPEPPDLTSTDSTDSTGPAPTVEETVDSEKKKAPSDWGTDSGQGAWLRDQIRNLIHVENIGWHSWDGTRWRPVGDLQVRERAQTLYRREFRTAVDKYKATEDDKWLERATAFKGFMSSTRIGRIMTAWSATPGVLYNASTLDAHPELLNTPSGIVNLRTGEVAPHDPQLFLTKVTRGSFRPGTDHPDWNKALASLPTELASYLQLRTGQAATGYTPESDDAIFLTGTGANGKSAFATDGVMPSLGDYASLASPNLIALRDGHTGATPERAGLRGCRFVLIEELPEGRALNIAEVKRITGTSRITARLLYKDDVTFDASHTLYVTSNYLPPVNETDYGSWRRLCRIPFRLRFVACPDGPGERVGDGGLKQRLREGKHGQHDAIVTWIVEGAMRYFAAPELASENDRPPDVEAATMEWRRSADRILAYVEDRLRLGVAEMVSTRDLYVDFCDWLVESGHQKWSRERFLGRFMDHESVKRAHVDRRRTRNVAAVNRPPEALNGWGKYPPLPSQPEVLVGCSFTGKGDAGFDFDTA